MAKQSKNFWLIWLSVLVGMLLLGGGMTWALYQLEHASTKWLAAITGIAAHLWLYYGVWRGRKQPWAYHVFTLMLSCDLAVAGYYGFMALHKPSMAISTIGAWALAACFIVGLWLIRLLLSSGTPVTGVARTLIDEAVRMKVALIFVVLLVLMLPMLPWVLDPTERLNYRVMFFLTWAMTGTSIILSVLTVLLTCWSVCTEISSKQIYVTMTKPVSPLEYLLGKWLGVMMLNALLVTMAGIGIYAFSNVLKQQAAQDPLDRLAVNSQVLVARTVEVPKPTESANFPRLYQERLEQLKREAPERYDVDKISEADERAIRGQMMSIWHAIPPRGAQVYRFTDLQSAVAYEEPIQLRFRPKAATPPPDEMVDLGLVINGLPWPIDRTGRPVPVRVSDNSYYVLNIPWEVISDDGFVDIQIHNLNESTVSFTPEKDLQVYYRVGSFGGNLARSMLMLWFKLSFLAMLGLLAGSFLGLPVACLLAALVYFAAVGSGFISEALESYSYFGTENLTAFEKLVKVPSDFFGYLSAGEIGKAIQMVIRLIGASFLLIVPRFDVYNPGPLLAEGKVVSWLMLRDAAIWIGGLWGGLCGVIAWLIFRKRELAKVIV